MKRTVTIISRGDPGDRDRPVGDSSRRESRSSPATVAPSPLLGKFAPTLKGQGTRRRHVLVEE